MLPIALKSFHIKNYRGIIDTQIDDIPPNTQWIFLTGENGFGKTSVLQALAIRLAKESSYENEGIECTLHGDENAEEDDFESILSYISPFPIYNIVAYGSTRLRVSGGTTREVMDDYSSVDSLFSNNTLLINIEEQFNGWYSNYREGYEQLVKIFKTLLPRLGKISVDIDDKTKLNKTTYYEEDLEHNIFKEGIIFNDLAAGYKNILAMIELRQCVGDCAACRFGLLPSAQGPLTRDGSASRGAEARWARTRQQGRLRPHTPRKPSPVAHSHAGVARPAM